MGSVALTLWVITVLCLAAGSVVCFFLRDFAMFVVLGLLALMVGPVALALFAR